MLYFRVHPFLISYVVNKISSSYLWQEFPVSMTITLRQEVREKELGYRRKQEGRWEGATSAPKGVEGHRNCLGEINIGIRVWKEGGCRSEVWNFMPASSWIVREFQESLLGFHRLSARILFPSVELENTIMRAFKYGFLQKTVLWGTDFRNRWHLDKSYASKVSGKKISLFSVL